MKVNVILKEGVDFGAVIASLESNGMSIERVNTMEGVITGEVENSEALKSLENVVKVENA